MTAFLERARSFLDQHRRLVRFGAVFIALFLAGFPLSRLIPRGVEVHYDLGDDHALVQELSLAYLPVGGESARAIRVRFENGAPQDYEHHVELAPGRYEVHARLIGSNVDRVVTRYLDVPRREDSEVIKLYDSSVFGF